MDEPARSPSETQRAPLVTVVIPCFDSGEFLHEAVASVEASLDPRWELIVVDDGSSDPATLEALSDLEGVGYRVIRQTNRGSGSARNTGVRAARGPYILPLDSDNRLRPEYVGRGIEILDDDRSVDVVYGLAELFGANTGRLDFGELELDQFAFQNPVDTCAVYRREVWERTGGYPEGLATEVGPADWDFWLSAVERGVRFKRLPEVLFDYRVRADSLSRRIGTPTERRRWVPWLIARHPTFFRDRWPMALAELHYRAALATEDWRGADQQARRLAARLRDKDEAIAHRSKLIDELWAKVDELHREVGQRDALLQGQRATIESLEREIARRDDVVAARWGEVDRLHREVARRDELVADLRRQLAGQSRAAADGPPPPESPA